MPEKRDMLDQEVAIRVSNLRKVYRLYNKPSHRLWDMLGLLPRSSGMAEHVALDDISFDIRKGEKVALIGRNGAGKSTLLKLISGAIEPNAGFAHVNGRAQALLQLGAGFHPDFTGRENAESYLAHFGVTGERAKEALEDIVAFAELEEYIDQPMKTYSTGMAVRLMFSVSTAFTPDILILDEVLSVGDAYFVSKSFERIETMCREQGTTMLLVTHDISSAGMLCDRFIWLESGRIFMDGSAGEVSNRYALSIREQEEKRLRQANAKRVQDASRRAPVFAALKTADGLPLPADLPIAAIRLSAQSGKAYNLNWVAKGAGSQDLLPYLEVGQHNWSDVNTLDNKQVRLFQRTGSIFHTAPFTIPDDVFTQLVTSGATIFCEIDYFDSFSRQLAVTVSARRGAGQDYQGILELHGSETWKTTKIELTQNRDTQKFEGKARFGSQNFSVDNIRFCDATGEEKTIFDLGKVFCVAMDYKISDPDFDECPVINISFVKDGVRIARMVCETHRFDKSVPRQGHIFATYDPLMLGPGEYTVNIAIMREGGYEGVSSVTYHSRNPNILDQHARLYSIKVAETHKLLLNDAAMATPAQFSINGVPATDMVTKFVVT